LQAGTVTLLQDRGQKNEWESFQASLQPAGTENDYVRILELELAFSDFRRTAIRNMGQTPEKDVESADRIRSEILPVFDMEIDHAISNKKTAALGFLRERRDCWQLLAEALQKSDPSKLSIHTEAWDRLNLVLIGLHGNRRKRTVRAPNELTEQFTQALATFTPRLMVTPAIIALNSLVFVLMVSSGIDYLAPDAEAVLKWGANFGPQTMNGEWWRLLTSMFLHFGVVHLAMNMWILWDFGRLVERLVGNTGFAILYLISGLAGSVASLAWNPTVISAGASGAVFGVGGALLGLTAFRRDTIPTAVLNHLRNSLFVFLAYNVWYGMKAKGIDHAAHLGGIFAGFLCGLIQNQPLSMEMLPNRRRRNLLTSAIGATGLITSVAVLPAAPLNTAVELKRFITVEDRSINSFERFGNEEAAGKISTADFADAIEKEILPEWVEVKHRIIKLSKMPYVNAEFFLELSGYMDERETAWLMYVDALRSNEPNLMSRADRKWMSANTLAEKMMEKSKIRAQ